MKSRRVKEEFSGLFHRGISQSGCAFCFWSIDENPSRLTNALANTFNCTTENSHKLVDCLRDVDATALVKSQLLLLVVLDLY